jgi:hypothetical protein
MECQFCKHMFSSKSALNTHQSKAKYCLKIQGKNDIKGQFICNLCEKSFLNNNRYKSHKNICRSNLFYVKESDILNNKIQELTRKLDISTTENEFLREELKKSQEKHQELSITAVKRPTVSNKNIQINNYIKNMTPLLECDITDSVQYLTLDHHVKGAEGYAEYALEFPFKNKIVCVDTARNKIKYKNGDGDVVEDLGFRKMMEKLCNALKDRSFNLSQEHYEKLSDKFTEKEVDDYNFMETAIAISKVANGRESEFCNQMIKMISRNSSII